MSFIVKGMGLIDIVAAGMITWHAYPFNIVEGVVVLSLIAKGGMSLVG